MKRTAALALVVPLWLCQAASARADEPDAWFGTDKVLHAGVALGIGAGGYAIGALAFDSRWAAVGVGAGFGLGLGALKEGFDAAGLGTPSYKDFVWDLVGTVLGIGVAITFDAALRGPLR